MTRRQRTDIVVIQVRAMKASGATAFPLALDVALDTILALADERDEAHRQWASLRDSWFQHAKRCPAVTSRQHDCCWIGDPCSKHNPPAAPAQGLRLVPAATEPPMPAPDAAPDPSDPFIRIDAANAARRAGR